MNTSDINDIIIFDQTESCPYLPQRTARMPLRMPLGGVSPAEAERRLAGGYRRTGEFIYRTQCPGCQACQPMRIDCREYRFSRNARRTLAIGDRRFEQQTGPLRCDAQRVDLFNKHRRLRGLAKQDREIDHEEYEWGFVRSCFQSFEITYWDDDQLVALAVCDRTSLSLSAVYTFYDPDLSDFGIGTYSIFKQIQFCLREKLQYLYLGYYISESPHMKYKSRFAPQQRLIDGEWVSFD